jgi:RNA polymerase sigma-70 factor (ECF subfamily)
VTPIQRVAQGDADAVRACIQAYGRLVWSLARRLSPAETEDAVQEIFTDLWRNAHRFDPAVASDVTFVAMIARRRLIDRLRARGRRVEGNHTGEVSEDVPDPGADRAELCAEAALARRALDRLRPEQRQVLLLSTREGMSHEEIAGALEMPLGTVKAHARRGLLKVREMLLGDNQRANVGEDAPDDDGGEP